MPALEPGSLVLVTGASGFIGTHVVRALSDAGFRVRAAVRSEAKGEYLRTLAPGLEVALVRDMAAPGAYKDAVKGVDGVVHVASPVDVDNPGDPQLVIAPAVAGVRELLDALGPETRRVVQLSDCAAIANELFPKGLTAEWNDEAVAICAREGADANPRYKYHGAQAMEAELIPASKVFAERAFWEYFQTHHDVDGVVLNPCLTFGPVLDFAASGGTVAGVASWLQPGASEPLEREEWNEVDVRGVADACVRALVTPEAGGQRFILAAHPLFMNDFALAAGRVSDTPGLTPGNPDPAYRAALEAKGVTMDNSRARKVLGVTFRDKDETLTAAARAVKETLDRKGV